MASTIASKRAYLISGLVTAASLALGVSPATAEPVTAQHPAAARSSDVCSEYATQHVTLRYGSQGRAVKLAQCYLNEVDLSTGGIDGKYGPKTTSAVRSFQKCVNVTQYPHVEVDGIVGPKTWSALVYAANRGWDCAGF
ncbi:peptidoglycan-binding domain-containing protein [Streptomyces sp. NPDC001795]|uniref:peptidoglycan-binding domain-containing protein n=1 Tax=unclassified Streptomyces TaxID=2593676 RepID=UPI00331E85F5